MDDQVKVDTSVGADIKKLLNLSEYEELKSLRLLCGALENAVTSAKICDPLLIGSLELLVKSVALMIERDIVQGGYEEEEGCEVSECEKGGCQYCRSFEG